MNSLTWIFLLLLLFVMIPFYSEKSNPNDFNIKIEGQVVNKLGEISKSTNGLLVEYIRNGTPRGSDLTDANGSFIINGVVTGINGIKDIENRIKLTGANPFEYETKVEISVKSPGKVIASTIDGKILDVTELPIEGTYTLSYDGLGSPDGMQIISVATNDWKDAVKVIKRGSRNATNGKGLDVIAYSQDISLDKMMLKGAAITEEDSIKITGKNISQTFHSFYHERQDVNLGQKIVNQGPEIKTSEVKKTTTQNTEITTNLNDYVYNDDQSRFNARNQNFTVEGANIKFKTGTIGTYETWIDVIDNENPNLRDSIIYKVEVKEEIDNQAPEFKIKGDILGKEDETIKLDLDKLASDNKTSPSEISWELTNGIFTESRITGREATLTPQKDRHGEDRITATITDLAGNKKTQEFKIHYQSVPDKPIANDDNDNTEYNKAKTTNVLLNDTDADNDIVPELTRIIKNPANGVAKKNIDASITYTPNNGFTGTDSYEYEISDATALKDSAKVTINVGANPNTAPIIQEIPNDSTDEDTAKKGVLLDEIVSDDFTSDNKIAWTITIDKPELLEVIIDENRQVEYRPKADKNGTVEITYTATDEGGLSSSKKQNFTINPVNDAPRQISPIANQTNPEDELLKINLENKFNDPEGETITYKLLNLPTDWTITWSGTEASINAPKDYNGTIEGLIIEAEDSNQNKTQSNTFTITKTAVNDAPNAQNDNASTDYQTSKTINVLANDTDIDSGLNKASIAIKQNPANGTITGINQATGEISYKPNNGFTGIDNFKYTVKDTEGLESNQATVTITVGNPPNQRPNANNDSATTNEDNPITIDVLANDTDDHGLNPASVTVITQPSHGNTSVNATNGKITYTPAADNNNDVTFQYSVADNEGLKDTATVSITINAVDDAPRFNGTIANQTNLEDVILTFDVAGKFSEPDGENMTYQLLNLPAGWTSSWSGTQVSVSAPADYNGTINNLKVEAKDPQNNTVQSNAFTITKTPVDDAPRKIADIPNQTNLEDITLTFSVANNFNEPDGENLTYQLTGLPTGWTSSWSGTNVSISAPTNYNGTITGLAVKAKDPQNNEATSNNFTITKTPVNDPVTFTGTIDNIVLNKNNSVQIDLKNYFQDIETPDENLIYNLEGLSLGTYTINNGILTINATTVGNETDLRASASDEATTANSNYFGLTVNNLPNTAPVISTIPADNTNEDTQKTATFSLDTYITDDYTSDANIQWSIAVSDPSKLTVSLDANRKPIYTPATDKNGSVTITYTATDEGGLTASKTQNFTINAVDDAPRKIADIPNQTNPEDITLTFSVANNFNEPDGENLTYQLTGLPTGWTSSWNGTNVSISAPTNYNGTITGLAVKAKDPQNNEATSNNFTITKTPVNDPVTFTGTIDNIVLNKNNSVQIDLKNYFQDIETPDENLIYNLEGLSLGTYTINNGILTINATTVGNETDLRAIAEDGETAANSNYFSLTVNDVVQKSTVTFRFRSAATDQDLSTGTSTLRYKKTGEGSYTTVTSTNGTFTIELDKNIAYEIDGSHSGDIETAYNAPSIYVALKRPGDMEAFEQRAIDDASSPATFTNPTETVYVYKLMSDFPLGHIQLYASELAGGINIGTRKFSTSNASAPIWWDKNYQNYTTTQKEWLDELRSELSSLPHVYLSLPFQEGTTPPGTPYTRVAVDARFPSPGTNVTSYNSTTNTITKAEAQYPLSFSENTFKIEILQAIGDLNDVGGQDPDILDANQNLNTTGRQIFSVLYLFKPKTKF